MGPSVLCTAFLCIVCQMCYRSWIERLAEVVSYLCSDNLVDIYGTKIIPCSSKSELSFTKLLDVYIVQILFLGLLAGCQITFIPAIRIYLSLLEVVVALLLSACPYYFTYRCVSSTASYITNFNHYEHLRLYPYDYVLFKPGKVCPTCLFFKPARSKHCSICKKCVAKQDHHCVWIMNCVGKGNYGYFIALLFSLSVMLTYGAYLGYSILDTILQRISTQASGKYARHHWSTGQNWSQYGSMWAYGLALDNRVGGIGLLAMFTAPMAWGFFAYHMYLIWAGMTTNESSKWKIGNIWSNWELSTGQKIQATRSWTIREPKSTNHIPPGQHLPNRLSRYTRMVICHRFHKGTG